MSTRARRDGSPEIARAAGAELLEIAPAEFGHGRTRNLAAEHTSGELICFLTQDATPLPGWLDAYEEAFALADDVGAAFGPHRPRPDTSVMIARELTDFFAGFTPDGGPALLGAGDPMFLSNVNACYRRDCWEQIRFDDVPYSEDQAFARAMGAHGWRRAYHPGAAVLHAHDYSPVGFMRRYFDEYRGLRETSGHVERIGVRSTIRDVRGLVGADRRWMREQGLARAAPGRGDRPLAAAPHHAQARRRRSARRRTVCRRRCSGRSRSRAAPPPAAAVPADGPKAPLVRPARGRGHVRGRSRRSRATASCRCCDAGARHGGRASGCTSPS